MFFSVRRRFFSGRKSSSSSWSWLREAWNFWERREAKDSFFGCSDANDGTGKKKAGVTAPWLHEYITSCSLWDCDVKKQHSLNIYGHSAGAAVMTVLLDTGWKLVFRRRANNRTEAFLSLLIGQEKQVSRHAPTKQCQWQHWQRVKCFHLVPSGLRDSPEMWPDYDKKCKTEQFKIRQLDQHLQVDWKVTFCAASGQKYSNSI